MTSTFDEIVSHLNASQPVAKRMRAIFGLKGLGTEASVKALEKSLLTDPSALVRHEVAYVLGQMCAHGAIGTLKSVLSDVNEDVMVRHEAGEALGAIGDVNTLEILDKYSDTQYAREIRETCILAAQRIRGEMKGPDKTKKNKKYGTVDPTLSNDGKSRMDTEQLRDILCNENENLENRYKAMFELRDRGGNTEVDALCQGMESEQKSALFRHEVAYVLGQMAHAGATKSLGRVLENRLEAPMVRHEAAEALGTIATKEAEDILAKYARDDDDVVRESVHVALDISDYVTSTNFHYADTLPKRQQQQQLQQNA